MTTEELEPGPQAGVEPVVATTTIGPIGEAPGADEESVRHLHAYNQERTPPGVVSAVVEAEATRLAEASSAYGLRDLPGVLREFLLPHFARADFLAGRYQTLYKWHGVLEYCLAALAVATVALQALFFPEHPKLIWLEVLQIAAILGLVEAAYRGEWHRKWVDYRFLAERLRASVFLVIAGLDCTRHEPPPHQNVGDNWMVGAFEWIWARVQERSGACRVSPVEDRAGASDAGGTEPEGLKPPVVKLLTEAWVADQAEFYEGKSSKFLRKHEQLSRCAHALFGLTLVVAVLHASGLGHYLLPQATLLPHVLAFLALVLPACAASLGAIRLHREYLRNSERYQQMGSYLKGIGQELGEGTAAPTKQLDLIRAAYETMMRENEDWRVVFLFHRPELP